VSAANVLFIDNPVGTGFSYVSDKSALTTNVQQIADDLLVLFKAFLNQLPEFKVWCVILLVFRLNVPFIQ
jgi:serine carboxypeptidase 1